MSGSDTKDPSSSGGGGGSKEEEKGEEGVTSSPAKSETGQGAGGDKEPRRVSIFRFGKARKKLKLLQYNRRRRRRRKDGSINSWGCFGRRGGGGGVLEGCCLCTKQPRTEDSSGESPSTSDPNSKEFTYDMLKVFIEKNDFYAAECNPHLDAS